jgi:hypothetical protein
LQNVVETFSIETLSKRSQLKRFQNVLNQNALKTFTKRFQQIVHYTLAFPLWFRPLVIPVLNGLFIVVLFIAVSETELFINPLMDMERTRIMD